MDLDSEDSASDVSMPVETDDEDEGNISTEAIEPRSGDHAEIPSFQNTTRELVLPGERELSTSAEAPNGQLADEHMHGAQKQEQSHLGFQTREATILMDKSLLPAEIWHYIFTFCTPQSLGALLLVNKRFNAYLVSSDMKSYVNPIAQSSLKPLKSEYIWAASRRHFALPGMQTMPAPLIGKSELDMWRIACGTLCQFCLKKGAEPAVPSADKWHPGPGENGVVPIFTLGIRSCGRCLEQHLTKEIDLLLSSSLPSPLMAALPFVLLTNELHVISISTLQNEQQPSSIRISKHYYKNHIEDIKKEFEGVKSLGIASAEEWLKGLEDRGKQRVDDSARWERWESAGGLVKMRASRIEERSMANSALNTTSAIPALSENNETGSNSFSGISSLPTPPHILNNAVAHLPRPVYSSFATNQPARFDSPVQNGFPFSFPSRLQQQGKHERTKEEVAEMKAARRAEIERRCLLLKPPLTAAVLAHMASFQAAIQIIQPLTDSAWEVLQPRLVSQREEAEQRESDRIAQTRVVQERFDERKFQDDEQTKSVTKDTKDSKDIKDLVDKEWEEIQAPLRERIGGYADEIIREGWNGGQKVSRENAALFAAEVLIYVRKRFYAEVAKDEAAVRATGREPELDPPNGPFTRKLTLENMKWIFDTKVKQHTEKYRKELFLCNACDYASKYYGFEGVIQHYAAKHTNALSAGSVVVHWKSEWPEFPPFNPDPTTTSIGASYLPTASSASASYPSSNIQALNLNLGYGGYQTAPLPPPIQACNPHGYLASPSPYYGHSQFGGQYSAHPNGPYLPPPPQQQVYVNPAQGYHIPQYTMTQSPPANTGYNRAMQGHNQQNYDSSYQTQMQGTYTSPHSGYAYPAEPMDVSGPQASTYHEDQYSSVPYGQQTEYASNSVPEAALRSEDYTTQLQELARNARAIWNSVGGLKEVPGSVKVYTIIYHVLKQFRASFQDDPPLSMMVEGLSNNKDMRPVRNVNGLLCKACSLGMTGSIPASQKKHFSFPQLVNHFHSSHEQEISHANIGQIPDWRTDMILLPEKAKLVTIVNAPNMDEEKLSLFREALPEINTTTAPQTTDTSRPSHHFGMIVEQDDYAQPPPSEDNHEKYYTTVDSGKQSRASSIAYGPGEYDPRHPAELPMPAQRLQQKSRPFERNEVQEITHEQFSYQPARDQHQPDPRDAENDRSIRAYAANSSSIRANPVDNYERYTAPDRHHVYIDEPVRYREVGVVKQYKQKPEPQAQAMDYHDEIIDRPMYRKLSSRSATDHVMGLSMSTGERRLGQEQNSKHINDPTIQQNRVFEVVAQVSQHAQQAREHLPNRSQVLDAGSEDGELRGETVPPTISSLKSTNQEAVNFADRFLDEISLGDARKDMSQGPPGMSSGPTGRWESDLPQSRELQRKLGEPQGVLHVDARHHGERFLTMDGHRDPVALEGSPLGDASRAFDEPQMQVRAYGEGHVNSGEYYPIRRDRSPELVDRRYVLNNVVYAEERQSSRHRTPGRFARYESVRLENDRARSRSPVYVKIGPQPGQYRERSPAARPLYQEPIYRAQTPLQYADQSSFERARRHEYVQVYPEEARPHQTRYAEAFEYIRVSDPQGDYMIRRPVHREIQPVYSTYEDDRYVRPQEMYEARAPLPLVARATTTSVAEGEEYDPRHPAPPAPVHY